MGKVSPVSIKYNIHAKFVAEGAVEKPDVIGAVFGQTEGLLGEDLDLRELQKNGKIGRIDVTLETSENKTMGEIDIPTSLDKAETTIIAATIETIEKIGPCSAKITIEKIEDVRSNKREYVLSRAKALLEQMSSNEPNSRELETAVKQSAREARIREYGSEMLPAGPDLDAREIIVVEGRADVVNLLRYGIKNVIGMNGTNMPKTIKELGAEKELTLFIDGDRGGILIAKNVVASANIAFIARAPAGKEVEELVDKEIISSLRSKMNAHEFLGAYARESDERHSRMGRGARRTRTAEEEGKKYGGESEEEKEEPMEFGEEKIKEIKKILQELTGTRGVCILDAECNVLKKIPISELSNLRYSDNACILVIDGTATNGIAKMAEKIGCKHLVAKNFAITLRTRINLVSI